MPNKVNKGEWAELFVFLKALSGGKIYVADENLERVEELFYVILSAIKEENGILKEFKRSQSSNQIILLENDSECLQIPVNEFEFFSNVVLETIKNGTGTFEIPEVEPFLSKIRLTKIKASSGSKKDIIFKIHDNFTGAEPQIGFSIKSYIGSKPTLLNASGATRVQYSLSKNLSNDELEMVNQIGGRTKIKDRVQFIKARDISLNFEKIENETFSRNLKMVDSRMPEFLGYLFLNSYFVSGKAIPKVVDLYCDEYGEDKEIISHKVKDLLVAVALGIPSGVV